MSAGDLKDLENCSLLEKEASGIRDRIWHGLNSRARLDLESSTWSHAISGRLNAVNKGGTQILGPSTPRTKFVCSLPLALTEKVGGWLNQAMLGFETGIPQIWSRCVQALCLTAQSLRISYFKRLHPFLVRLSIIIRTLAVFAGWFACMLAMLTVLVSTSGIIMGSTPFASESDRQERSLCIRLLLFQAVIASATIPIVLCLAGGVILFFLSLLYIGAGLLLALLLDCGDVFIRSIVTWIAELCSRFISYIYVMVKSSVRLLAPDPPAVNII
ncbi:hypothetical protein R1sor_021504 [Riccia sorocarpa]|uniref:Uncharacterized protein n=1 Tax=Riccia sorocarpa TaxID=122646 RepID=A0ABD3GI02_9MARC